MKTLVSEYNNRKYKNVEIVENIDSLPCDAVQIDTILDSDSMTRYAIYKDSSCLYYAINEDED